VNAAPQQQIELRRRLDALGFDDVRFAAIAGAVTDPLRAWVDAGMHADMHWMERTTDKRLNPDLVLTGARSMIVLGVNYWSEKIRPPQSAHRNSPSATWARYALHEDYHDTIKPALVTAGRLLEEMFGASSEDLARTCHVHPTLGEAMREAALAVSGRALHV